MGEFLLVTIQVDLHDQRVLELRDDLSERILSYRAQGVLVDISALVMVDSFIARMLGNIGQMSRLLAANMVLVGMQPAVAITLVEMGISMSGIRTALNVDRGMALLRREQQEARGIGEAAAQ